MSSQSSQSVDNKPQSPEPADLSLSNDEQEDLSGIVLSSGPYQLRKILRRDNHYNVYSICSLSNVDTVGMEARTYRLDEIPNKLRKYRLKSMQRLSSRRKLEERQRGVVIVVYMVVDNMTTKGSKKNTTVQKLQHKEDDIQITKPKAKSDRQREAARLRQLERRQKNRRKEKESGEEKEGEGEETDEDREENDEPTDEEERLYVLLHLAYSNNPELVQQLPRVSRDALDKYHQTKLLRFENDEEIEAFMTIKLEEVLFLSRQEKVLPDREKQMRDEQEALNRRWTLSISKNELGDCSKAQNMIILARQKLRVIKNVQKFLPFATGYTDFLYQELKKRLEEVRNLKKDISDRDAVYAEWMRLKQRVVFCERFSKAVLLGSTLYAHMRSQLITASEDQIRFEDKMDQSSRASLSSWEQYTNLMYL